MLGWTPAWYQSLQVYLLSSSVAPPHRRQVESSRAVVALPPRTEAHSKLGSCPRDHCSQRCIQRSAMDIKGWQRSQADTCMYLLLPGRCDSHRLSPAAAAKRLSLPCSLVMLEFPPSSQLWIWQSDGELRFRTPSCPSGLTSTVEACPAIARSKQSCRSLYPLRGVVQFDHGPNSRCRISVPAMRTTRTTGTGCQSSSPRYELGLEA